MGLRAPRYDPTGRVQRFKGSVVQGAKVQRFRVQRSEVGGSKFEVPGCRVVIVFICTV